MVCLDSCFLVDYLREQRTMDQGRATKKLYDLKVVGEAPKTTTINLTELYFGPYYTNCQRIMAQIDGIVSTLEILTLSVDAARCAASIAAELKRTGAPLVLPMFSSPALC